MNKKEISKYFSAMAKLSHKNRDKSQYSRAGKARWAKKKPVDKPIA